MADKLAIQNRCAVITGAASGIGRSLALEAAARGMSLALADIDEAGLVALVDELASGGAKVLGRPVDVRDPASVEAFAQAAFDAGDSVAIVFANAGITQRIDGLRPDLNVWNRVIDVNLRGPVHMVKSFMERLIDAGEPAQFAITGSQASFTAAPTIMPYIATKHAVWGLADSLRIELLQARAAVRMSLIAPGRVTSAITRSSAELVRSKDGDAAAAAYAAALMSPDGAAKLILDRVIEREFWIMPTPEPIAPHVRRRFEEIFEAEARDFAASQALNS